VEQPALPVRFGPEPLPPRRTAVPSLGEHSHEVLAVLGFDPDERGRLFASGAVATDA
jgi:crotonobetainyl-CoA:carnitine CoA-transferase CaiB-like acyl-CoA transferase